jgi:CBS domain-containing protein
MKSDVAYLVDNMTVAHALQEMHDNGFTAVPVISTAGEYVETVTEGDFLRYVMDNGYNTKAAAERDMLTDIPKRRDYQPVHVNARLDDLVELAKTQNFVPVVDDRGIFIGIVTRKDLIVYACGKIK